MQLCLLQGITLSSGLPEGAYQPSAQGVRTVFVFWASTKLVSVPWCHNCQRKHHTSLCGETNPKQETSEPRAEPSVTTATTTTATASGTATTSATTDTSVTMIISWATTATAAFHLAGHTTCLLKTVVTNISFRGIHVQSNILFDEGSQCSFLTKGLVDCLKVQQPCWSPYQGNHLLAAEDGSIAHIQ